MKKLNKVDILKANIELLEYRVKENKQLILEKINLKNLLRKNNITI